MSLYTTLCAIYKAAARVVHPMEVTGAENLPREGAYMLLSNHINLHDPLTLGTIAGREISFMAKKELFDNKLLGALLTKVNAFPVDRGKADLNALRHALSVLKNGGVLGIFPEGHRYTDGRLHEIQGGAALIVLRSGVPFVPVCISGSYRWFRKLHVKIGAPVTFSQPGGKITDCTDTIRAALEEVRR